MKRILSRTASILLAAMASCGAPEPPLTDCSQLANAPDKYVGRRVLFLGSMTGVNMQITAQQAETINTWDCKTSDGTSVEGGVFAFASSDAEWTAAASKSDSFKTLFRVSGTVKEGGSVPFLKNVKVQLATESPTP